MHSDTIRYILEYIWIPIVTVLVSLWVKLTGLDTRTQLLEKSEKLHMKQIENDRAVRESQRAEMLAKVDRHHDVVMKKLDSLEQRIKNGH